MPLLPDWLSDPRLRRDGVARIKSVSHWLPGWDASISGAWAIAAIVVIFTIPVQFFVSRMVPEALNYFLMAESVARTGRAYAPLAQNIAPVPYAVGAGYLYAPVMLLFDSFELRIRAIQVMNVGMLGAFLYFSLRYFRLLLPPGAARWIGGFFALAMSIDTRLSFTAIVPNADLFPALVTVIAFVTSHSVKLGERAKFAVILALVLSAFAIKFSVVALVVAFGALQIARLPARQRLIVLAGVAVAAGALLSNGVSRYYIYIFFLHISRLGQAWGIGSSLAHYGTNLFFGALPDAIVPNFRFLLLHESFLGQSIKLVAFDIPTIFAIVVGSGISAMVIAGGVLLWRRSQFEVLAALISIPVFAVITSSTWRYLFAFQPFLWVCFATALLRAVPNLKFDWRYVGAGLAVVAGLLLFIQERSVHVASRGATSLASTTTGLSGYFESVAAVYGGVQAYLRELPDHDNVRIVHATGDRHPSSMWRVTAGIPTYSLDYGFPGWEQGHRVLIVLACRSLNCKESEDLRRQVFTKIQTRCGYPIVPLAHWQKATTRAEIFQIDQTRPCSPGKTSSAGWPRLERAG